MSVTQVSFARRIKQGYRTFHFENRLNSFGDSGVSKQLPNQSHYEKYPSQVQVNPPGTGEWYSLDGLSAITPEALLKHLGNHYYKYVATGPFVVNFGMYVCLAQVSSGIHPHVHTR